MEKEEKIAFAVTGLIFLFVGYTIVGDGNLPLPNKKVNEKLKCKTDSDCVAGGSCCHPSQCVNKGYAEEFKEEECKGVMCTEVCKPCPECKCIESKCKKIGEKTVKEGVCC